MKDQVEQLRAFGVSALFLNSSLSPQEYQENMDYVKRGEVKLLYVAPETLLTPRILSLLAGLKVDCLTIDEAHCISEWGHDFRPEYRQLVQVRKQFPNAVCLALTATATARVRLHAPVRHFQRVRRQFQPREPVHRSRPQTRPDHADHRNARTLQGSVGHRLLFLAQTSG
jgi:superfamily II DNA helicase RecQ